MTGQLDTAYDLAASNQHWGIWFLIAPGSVLLYYDQGNTFCYDSIFFIPKQLKQSQSKICTWDLQEQHRHHLPVIRLLPDLGHSG